MVIEFRHAFTHPDSSKGVTLADYELTASLAIEPPSITIKHPMYPIPTMPLLQFCDIQLEQAVVCSEELLAWLCELNAESNTFIEHHVETLPYDKLRSGSPLRWQTSFRPGYPMPAAPGFEDGA